MWPNIPRWYWRNPGPTPFHIPLSCASTNQCRPSSSSSTRGTRSFHFPGACDDQRSGGRYVRSMWLSPEMSVEVMTPPVSLALPPELRIPRVPQSITEEVEAQHGQADRQAREDREPRGLLHERAARAAEHQAPGGRGRLSPQPEEAQRCFDQDRVAQPDRRDDEDGRGHVGEDVGDQDSRLAAADGLRRLDVPVLLRREHRATDDARVTGNDHHGDREHRVRRAGLQYRHDRERQHQPRNRLDRVHDALEHEIEATLPVATRQTDDRTGERSEPDGEKPDPQRDAGAVNDATEHVTADVVGAEEVRPARWRQPDLRLRLQWIVRRQDVGEDGGEHQDRKRSEERRVGKECRSRWSPY